MAAVHAEILSSFVAGIQEEGRWPIRGGLKRCLLTSPWHSDFSHHSMCLILYGLDWQDWVAKGTTFSAIVDSKIRGANLSALGLLDL